MLVVQIASNEASRTNFGETDLSLHQYPYTLLHDGTIEEIGFFRRTYGILKTIIKFKPDVINLTGYDDVASWIVIVFCKLRGIKTILSNESTNSDHQRSAVKEFIKKLIISQFDGFFNFGTESKKYMISLGADANKMLVNRNCVDNQKLKTIYENHLPFRKEKQSQLKVASKNFIFIGRLINYKNLIFFLESFSFSHNNSENDWGVLILGNGVQKTELEEFIKERQIRNVHFEDGVSWQEVPKYLALSDVLVLPSYSEPWGLVVNEAMACGLPVLVSEKCGCATDLVRNGENGFIFSPFNSLELSKLLLKFINEEVDVKQMGIASENIIKDFSPENVANEMYDGFKSVLNPNA